jgi:CheY-like chemotaxis protein
MLEERISIFYAYAPEDERLQRRLEQHLSILEQQGTILAWHKRSIQAGSDWQKAVDTYLNSAQIILLLISANFLASPYCYGIEMQRALERQKCGDALVIPIILRPVDWQESPFGKLEVLPRGAEPVTGRAWKNLDEAFASIAHDLRGMVYRLRAQAQLENRRAAHSTARDSTHPKVLIIEDDEVVGNYLKLSLEHEGIPAEYALDGEEGLRKAKEVAPGLILLDLALPVIEGFEVLRRLRTAPETRSTPILMLTARDNTSYRARAYELGADDYLLKPFHISELLLHVRSRLEGPAPGGGRERPASL